MQWNKQDPPECGHLPGAGLADRVEIFIGAIRILPILQRQR